MQHLRRLAVLVLFALVLAALSPVAAARPQTSPAQTQGPAGRLPVILIPGIGGSELYNDKELVWLSARNVIGSQIPILSLFYMGWLMPLRLAADGEAPFHPSYRIRVGDVLRSGVTDGYSGLVTSLVSQGYVEGKDLQLLPYDWRKHPSTAVAQLGDLVDRTLKETGANQVILIGHSQGGLVARDYAVRGGGPKIKAMIALGTPWLGTPMAYRALAYGWDLGMRIPGTEWSIMAPHDVKILVRNYPSVYAMAPGPRYFDWYPDGYLQRGGKALTYDQSYNQGVAPHNSDLANKTAHYLNGLLDGRDHGVMQFLFAGTGRSTLGTVLENTDWLGFTHKTERFTDGDEIVPLHSADLGFSKDERKAQQYIGKVVSVAYANVHHTFIAQSPAVHDVIRLWLDVIHGRRASG